MIVRKYEEDEVTVHRVPLMLAGGVVAITLTLTAAVSFGYLDRQAVPAEIRAAAGTTALATRSLLFFDESDGTVRVEDATTRTSIGRFEPGTGGFIRSSVRSLVYQRRIRGIGRETPFELTGWDNGALTLRDSTTDRSLELASFGPDNRAVFAAMLDTRLDTDRAIGMEIGRGAESITGEVR
jgi:putative photosynthetic complex assembly protein